MSPLLLLDSVEEEEDEGMKEEGDEGGLWKREDEEGLDGSEQNLTGELLSGELLPRLASSSSSSS